MKVPDELVSLASERRVIPFVGAGFSAALGLPTWESLLRQVAEEMESVPPFDEILRFTHGDLLQTAEFLYLRSNRHIGPIRHFLERGLSHHSDPTTSGAHVELVNLNAPQIYTTNYDDIIEHTYKALSLPVASVVLPRDVALSDTKKTQVVKYHGDLRHEETLVLTESSYYRRLDFESPMDLKFRSDLLGRSVLFMGYSFRDINIRVIWFKLLEMMKDVPESDRTPSYIVRTQPNPVLEELYKSVGLKTIVLSDEDRDLTPGEVSDLHGEFLLSLADGARVRGSRHHPWLSSARLARLEDLIDLYEKRRQRYDRVINRPSPRALVGLSPREIPPPDRVPTALMSRAHSLYQRALMNDLVDSTRWKLVQAILKKFGPSRAITHYFARAIASGADPSTRRDLLSSGLPWDQIWTQKVFTETVIDIERRLAEEVIYCEGEGIDDDIAYVADVAKRIVSGQIYDLSEDTHAVDRLSATLAEAEVILPEIRDYSPQENERPTPDTLVRALQKRPNFDDRGEPRLALRGRSVARKAVKN